jgi:hypothetical protein
MVGGSDSVEGRVVDSGPYLVGGSSPVAEGMVESMTPRSIGALDGSLPQVSLAGGNRRLVGPAELGAAVRQWPGGKGIIGDIDTTAISYIRKGCDLKKYTNSIYIIEVIRSKVGKKTEVIHQVSIICAGEGDKLGLCNF